MSDYRYEVRDATAGPELNPMDNMGGVARLVGWHRKYINPTPEFDSPAEVQAYARETGAHLLKCYLFDHSGTRYYLADDMASCAWDSGFFGFLIVEKSHLESLGWKRVTPQRHAQLLKDFEGLMEEYTNWANGWGWAYTVYDGDEVVSESSVYLSDDYCEAEAQEEVERLEGSAA